MVRRDNGKQHEVGGEVDRERQALDTLVDAHDWEICLQGLGGDKQALKDAFLNDSAFLNCYFGLCLNSISIVMQERLFLFSRH
jgi:hypothetical protein